MKIEEILKFIIPILFFFAISCSHNHTEKDHEDSDSPHSESHSHEGAFEIEDHQIEKFGILSDTIFPSSFHEVIKTAGRIETSASDIYTVTARKSGIFTLASGITQGSSLKQGETIGTISPEGIAGGDPQRALSVNLEAAKKEYERLKPLYDDGLVTASTFNEAERVYNEAKALTSKTVSGGSVSETSPCAGILTELLVGSGQFVETGATLAKVVKNSKMILRADIPGRYSSKIYTVTTANFRPEGSDSVMSLSSMNGKLLSSQTTATGENGYIPLYFLFEGNPGSIAGTFTEVFLIGNRRENVMSVPLSSLIEMQGNLYLYVVHHGEDFEKRLVKTGGSDGERIEILEGLSPGDVVVTKGASVVRMIETSAIAPPSHSHNH